jgi:aminoglycoside phosphotransferase
MISLAAPAYADLARPIDGDDAGFLAALRQDGISYASPGQAVTAGKAVCTCVNNGESGLRLIHNVKTHNPGFDMESASQFAVIAPKYYCPNNSPRADAEDGVTASAGPARPPAASCAMAGWPASP